MGSEQKSFLLQALQNLPIHTLSNCSAACFSKHNDSQLRGQILPCSVGQGPDLHDFFQRNCEQFLTLSLTDEILPILDTMEE